MYYLRFFEGYLVCIQGYIRSPVYYVKYISAYVGYKEAIDVMKRKYVVPFIKLKTINKNTTICCKTNCYFFISSYPLNYSVSFHNISF